MTTDEEDYFAFLQGDNQGFERLVLRYKDGLIFYINRMLHNLSTAEDLAQDAFVEVLVHKERFVPGKASFKTYLYTIGHHKAVDYVRKSGKEYLTDFEAEETLPANEEETPESLLLKKEDKEQLYAALSSLKEEYQKVLFLTEMEGMRQKDAAQVLGKTVPQTKILAHRARKALAAVLSQK